MISVLLACCSRDQDQALAVLKWAGELGMNYTKLFILCSKECQVDKLMAAGEKAFSSVTYLRDVEEVDSNWYEVGHHKKSAAGPNSLFRQACWHFYGPSINDPNADKSGWLFWEPDAIPCYQGWLRDINDEYDQAVKLGKLFLGFEVNRKTHPGDVGSHMSGVAVYPYDVPIRAHTSISAGDVAFDVEGAEKIVPQMMPSRTIFHRYRPPSFTTQEDFEERVPRNLAIYHAVKDGSLFPFLAKRLGIGSAFVTAQEQTGEMVVGLARNPELAPVSKYESTVDIFIKTRKHDFPWLEWSLKSIKKFGSGFRQTIVLDDTVEELRLWDGVENKTVFSKEPGYLWQQVCKLHADQHTDSDFILFMDSDCVLTRPVIPDEFIRNGKPVWQYTPLDQARSDQHVWVPVMEKFLGRKPQHEFMRRHPFIVPRWAFEELRTFCKYRHGKSLEEYILGEADPSNGLALRFSEWNCLGFFLWEYHRDRVEWVLDADAGPSCVYQGFTHAGESRKLEDIAKFKELLHDGRETGNSVAGEPPTNGASTLSVVSTPSLTIGSCIEFIAGNVKDNAHKARIMRQIKSAWKGKGNVFPTRKKAVSAPRKDSLLLAVHSYPGANETFARHWTSYQKSGATRIIGIGTTDHGCEFPCESVEIGKNAYMKLKGKDTHLCERLIDTVKWCLAQPEERFCISEYDTIFLRKLPHFTGINAHLTGGQVNGSKATQFFHNPWCFDRESGPRLVAALEAVLPDSTTYPDNSPDLFFGLACERAQIEVGCTWKMFTRNSLDAPGDLDLAVQAARDGVHVIHGIKLDFQYFSILESLNGKHLELSHQAV